MSISNYQSLYSSNYYSSNNDFPSQNPYQKYKKMIERENTQNSKTHSVRRKIAKTNEIAKSY